MYVWLGGFLFVLLVYVIIITFFERWLKKKFKIPKSEGFINKPVNKVHKWLEIVLIIGFIIGYASTGSVLILFCFFTSLYILRSLMQWLFRREQKQYILELFGILLYLIIMIIFKIMLMWKEKKIYRFLIRNT